MISYNFHRIVIGFILSFIVSITCVIFRLGCSLKTEFMRAILAALRRASAFVGQVWLVWLLVLVSLLVLVLASLAGILIFVKVCSLALISEGRAMNDQMSMFDNHHLHLYLHQEQRFNVGHG